MVIRTFDCTLTPFLKLILFTYSILGLFFVAMIINEKENQPPSQLEPYLSDRLNRIKLSCQDVCQINDFINGKLVTYII